MATKSTATADECYNRLEPDEPYFCLMARDPDFEVMVRTWALHRRMQISSGARTNNADENKQIAEALNCAQEGKAWREEYLVRKARQAGLEFNHEGYVINRELPKSIGIGESIQKEAERLPNRTSTI